MERRLFLKKGILTGVGLLCIPYMGCSNKDDVPEQQETKHPSITPDPDIDLFGSILDNEGNPVVGAVVSDGYSCVITDSKGVYQMKRNPKALTVFVSIPEQYKINVVSSKNSTASFYCHLNSGNRYNFDLTRLNEVENDFNLICIGDPQVKGTDTVERYRNETLTDLKETLQSLVLPYYGLVLGDTVHDQPSFFRQMQETTGSVGMPYFTTIGNHDKTGGSDSTPRTTTVYTATFGPVNYSWNRGRVHFISLDDVLFSSNSSYACGLEDYQIEWLKQDLSYVPKDKMIIIYYHIQMRDASFQNRDAFFQAIKDYGNVHLMAGHTHYTDNYQITNPRSLFEHIHGAACGAWWNSTINTDGTPNGYGVYEIRGTELKNWYYKSVRYSKDVQIRMHKGNTQFGGSYGYFSYNQGENIIANIWNADPAWRIEAYEDGVWAGNMVNLGTIIDAFSVGYHVGVLNKDTDSFRAKSGSNKHAYLHTLKNKGAQRIEIRATDRFGRTYSQTEFITDIATAARY